MRYIFPAPIRMNASDSTLYSRPVIPELDREDRGYRVELSVRAADPHLERRIGREIVSTVNLRPEILSTLSKARALLDSVAYISKEGDSAPVIREIDALLNDLRYGYGANIKG